MANRADDLIDRRQLRRKLTFWRVAAFLTAALAIIVGTVLMYDDSLSTSRDHIAKIKIEGTITEDEDLLERLVKLRETPTVKGVMLSIDSPGGTTAGGEAIYEEVRRLAAAKPVVAQVGTLAASAGYMIASATDHIVARQSSIVGSIGVLVQIPNVSGLMNKVGVSVDEVKSSALKAEPSPFNTTTEPELAMMRSMILDSYNWFVDLVDQRRPMTRTEVLAVADGSVFTGRQGLEKKLVDELGGEEAAIAWLQSKGVAPKLKVIEWKPDDDGSSSWLLGKAGTAVLDAIGLGSSARNLSSRLGTDAMFLDGLVSVWQPDFAPDVTK